MTDDYDGIFLGIGGNLGDREQNLHAALEKISTTTSIALLRISSFYRSEPWGVEEQPWFLNAVCEIETQLNPHTLLKKLKVIETELGRKKSPVRWGPRKIDIDIILYRNLVIETPELIIPHPHCTERPFVLIPLLEIAPEILHPATGIAFGIYLERIGNDAAKKCSLFIPAANKRR